MINKEYVSYEQALKLKELGFDLECDYKYEDNRDLLGMINLINVHKFYHMTGVELNSDVPAPTLYQAQEWLRGKEIDICICRSFSMKHSYHYEILINQDYDNLIQQDCIPNRTYEASLSEAISKSLELYETLRKREES